jgi:hypothetical protein
MITAQQLSGFLGKSIAQICPNGFTSEAHSHSAHFVGHALGYAFGATCHLIGSRNGPAATRRVQEIFSACQRVGVWSLRPSTLGTCLVFITRASNVNLPGKVMANAPRKHVGIFVDGSVWHYSSSQRKVVKETLARFSLHYPAPDNAMFYGSLPGTRGG